MSKVLLFGLIASVLTINAFADPVTITTQDYVDTTVATKQDKISAHGTVSFGNVSAYGLPDSVITDTDTNGVVAKRPIIYGGNDGAWYLTTDRMGSALRQGSLLTNAQVKGMANAFGYSESDMNNALISAGVINDAFDKTNELVKNKQSKKVCVRWLDGAAETDENCLLWNLP